MNYFLDQHLLLIDHTVQISIYRLVQFQNLTTIDHAKWRKYKINPCENIRLNKPHLFCLDKEI